MRKKTYLKLVDYQTEQSEKHLNEVRSIHKEMRGYKHDFHHHLQTLKGQLEAGEIERALAYIEQLDTQLMQVDTLLKTGNVSLDAILSAKIAQAKAGRGSSPPSCDRRCSRCSCNGSTSYQPESI